MEYIAGNFDIAVVGAGHAGCEAALACARLGMRTIIFAINLDSIANMPCNPNVGGTGKGHLVRELDALGGEMGKCTDKTLIQSKTLNSAKGPAVYSLRAQVDRRRYQMEMKNTLENQDNLYIKQAEITELLTDGENHVIGVKTHTDAIYHCKAAILTTGTYLKGKIIIGDISYSGGPDGLFPANRLSDSLSEKGIELMRFKTGTPARINGKTLDFSKMTEQLGDDIIIPFSFEDEEIIREQVSCWLTYTNDNTHGIIKANLHRSPLYSGMIEGVGPRYCPSIEDKVVRFADKERHQVFVEPMGLGTQEMYLQGMSSSLPEDVQIEMVHSLPGLENAHIMRSAYAIEYDCIDPTQLKLSLEFKHIDGLFSAGQINGSSGYEEAAAQGIIAGINAARKLQDKPPLILERSEAYIGVLIDDLITKGTSEPYRVMTSRSEYRLLLRQDNADLRLTPRGFEVGLISEERYRKFIDKKTIIEKEIHRLENTYAPPSVEVNEFLSSLSSTNIKSGAKLSELLRRPEVTYSALEAIDHERPEYFKAENRQKYDPAAEQVEIATKYEGYVKRQMSQVEQFSKLERRQIPEDIDYTSIHGLRIEARQKLTKMRPISVGQASRISGVSPADISVLLIYLSARVLQQSAHKTIEEFLVAGARQFSIGLTDEKVSLLLEYKRILLEWNEKMNLTAIEEEREFITKHFLDSLSILPFLNNITTLVDVGTGAGFPGIPLKIVQPSLQVVLMDSLEKRIGFLKAVVSELKLDGISAVHCRAEDAGASPAHREKYDVAVARAVASLPVLLEYCMPLVKTGGIFIAMKGSSADEIKASEKALELLGGRIEQVRDFTLPDSDMNRSVIIVKKLRQTPTKYPRKAGKPTKEPLI